MLWKPLKRALPVRRFILMLLYSTVDPEALLAPSHYVGDGGYGWEGFGQDLLLRVALPVPKECPIL